MADTPGALVRGVDAIRDYLPRLPAKPGVYRMLAADGAVLYVGKAKNLKARVTQYAQGRGHGFGNRIVRMIGQTASMEFVVTGTETEALLLEANLIKRLAPRYNILLRDDKSFPLIAIRKNHAFAALQKHRGAKTFKGSFFGPFASAGAVNRTLNTLQKAFLLRSCSDSVFANRTRPCMLYQIKRCSAPCTNLATPTEYDELVREATDFLCGRSADLQDRLAADMQAAAADMQFETAARLRDRIRALSAIRAAHGVNPQTFAEADVFAIHMAGGVSCVQVFFFRAGQNWGNRAYFPRHERDAECEEVLDAFLAQFYEDKDPPSLILTSVEPPGRALLEEALTIKAEKKISVRMPVRGEKKDVMDQAALNAREALARRLAEGESVAKLMDGVAEAFGLTAPPDRIEVYDNSHIQGTNAVGAFIVAGPEGFVKNQYRKFTIRSVDLTPGDDFAMMKEVLKRRFARLLRENPKEEENAPAPADIEGGVDFSREEKAVAWPSLVLIDGGEGQLAAALETLASLGLTPADVPIVGIAKGVDRDAGMERFFMPGRAPFRMEAKSPVLYYLQRLRDEAHRFAIGAHRQKRKIEMGRNPLDEIAGVGPARKKALLNRFGSAREVGRASLTELGAVEGVSTELAARIHAFFHGKPS
jgi:excinuclease ABC subunit C